MCCGASRVDVAHELARVRDTGLGPAQAFEPPHARVCHLRGGGVAEEGGREEQRSVEGLQAGPWALAR